MERCPMVLIEIEGFSVISVFYKIIYMIDREISIGLSVCMRMCVLAYM